MRTFITARPEVTSADFGSPYDPVLVGVAQGLSHLFPPVRQVRPPRDDGSDAAGEGHAEARPTASAGGQGRG
ncbi:MULTISPECIES: hypothetical protein [Methylorubrum]|uniref:Uncharacterized protein n=1 Tax=Methylorubrum suomiense TaxID=144191 RepID=A0ABQ4USD6_9HYPH|nr:MULTISPECIES: hypothetical protein [Methylobacteriaceae]GJE74605.1 hypothetical protein BGCPKDLD_1176 [Methylorubrum suomiense]